MIEAKRKIGEHTGTIPGPLVIVTAALHGNEPAGVQALTEVFRMLEREPDSNPDFSFRGRLVGFIGNLSAYAAQQRFEKQDLNRLWTIENMARVRALPPGQLTAEEREMCELDAAIRMEIETTEVSEVIFLDLHTTSADGGIFCIPTHGGRSLALAEQLHAPVILGLLDGVKGTLLQYYSEADERVSGVAFEGGQHQDPNSVSRSISAIVNCLRSAGCVQPADVDNRHDAVLSAYSASLPRRTRLFHIHRVHQEDRFVMQPGYVNFQRVLEGEHLADDKGGPIVAPKDCCILMPLYQPQGADGFFLVEEIPTSL